MIEALEISKAQKKDELKTCEINWEDTTNKMNDTKAHVRGEGEALKKLKGGLVKAEKDLSRY